MCFCKVERSFVDHQIDRLQAVLSEEVIIPASYAVPWIVDDGTGDQFCIHHGTEDPRTDDATGQDRCDSPDANCELPVLSGEMPKNRIVDHSDRAVLIKTIFMREFSVVDVGLVTDFADRVSLSPPISS